MPLSVTMALYLWIASHTESFLLQKRRFQKGAVKYPKTGKMFMKKIFQVVITALLISCSSSNLYCGQSQKGLLITAVGLPWSGKSSVMRELATLIDGTCFCEPEEKDWPDAVKMRELSGNFTMISWFRSVRLPQLLRANQVRSFGDIAITDSYYDKLLAYYIGKPGMEWLINPSDPYFDVTVAMAKKDWDQLPNADVIVFFEISLDLWKNFIAKWNQSLDCDPKFLESFSTQELFLNACQKLCDEKHITLIKIKQEWSSPREMAIKIKNALYTKGILHPEQETPLK